jgi:hypothetical protein
MRTKAKMFKGIMSLFLYGTRVLCTWWDGIPDARISFSICFRLAALFHSAIPSDRELRLQHGLLWHLLPILEVQLLDNVRVKSIQKEGRVERQVPESY